MSVPLSMEEIRRQFRLPDDFPEDLVPLQYREVAFGTVEPLPQGSSLPLYTGRILSEVVLFLGFENKVLRFIENQGDSIPRYRYEEVLVRAAGLGEV